MQGRRGGIKKGSLFRFVGKLSYIFFLRLHFSSTINLQYFFVHKNIPFPWNHLLIEYLTFGNPFFDLRYRHMLQVTQCLIWPVVGQTVYTCITFFQLLFRWFIQEQKIKANAENHLPKTIFWVARKFNFRERSHCGWMTTPFFHSYTFLLPSVPPPHTHAIHERMGWMAIDVSGQYFNRQWKVATEENWLSNI